MKSVLSISPQQLIQKGQRLLTLAAASLLAACAGTPKPGEAPDDKNGWSMHGIESVVRRDIETVNLLYLLDPEGKGRKLQEKSSPRRWDELQLSEKYEFGFNAFETQYNYSKEQKKELRNMVQERIMAASERRCNHFLIEFRKRHADTNFAIGLGTTISAGLGAIVPGVTASKNLSGLATILSGTRGEFNDAYYANLATSVIIRGISEARGEALERLRSLGVQDAGKYSMTAAVNDAIHFDGLCSVAVGLDKANEALTKLADPGLDAMNRANLKTNITNRLAKGDYDGLKQDLGKLDEAGIDTRWLVPRGRALASSVGHSSVGVSTYDELSVGDNAQAYVDGLAKKAKERALSAQAQAKAKISKLFPSAMNAEEKELTNKNLTALLNNQTIEPLTVSVFTAAGKSYKETTSTTTTQWTSTTPTLSNFQDELQSSCIEGSATLAAVAAYNDAQKALNKAKLLGKSGDEQGAQFNLQNADDRLRAISRQFDAYVKSYEAKYDAWIKGIDRLADDQAVEPAIKSWKLFAGLITSAKKFEAPQWDKKAVPAGLQCK
jgi:hypothetical protein